MIEQNRGGGEVIGEHVGDNDDRRAGLHKVVLAQDFCCLLDGFVNGGGEGELKGRHASRERELAADALLRREGVEGPAPAASSTRHDHEFFNA